jgi:hypothetical protein
MKVLNLQCSRQHSFEGWFGSEDDFQSQLSRGLIECPLCADIGIQKMPSAPRLNFGERQTRSADPSTLEPNTPSAPLPAVADRRNQVSSGKPDGMSPAVQAAFLNALRQVVANTEDVGPQFSEEARRMHYGEVSSRSIRGQASAREVVDLMEEGIEVMPLPMLPALKETLQ